MSLGGGDLGHAGLGGSLGAGLGHAGLGVGTGEGTGRGAMSQSLGGGHGTSGLGVSRAPIGLGLTKGIGTSGSGDLPLGLSSRELGLGNNFGPDASDNVLSRAARVETSPAEASDGSETKAARKEGAQAGRSEAIDSEEQMLLQQQLSAEMASRPAADTVPLDNNREPCRSQPRR